MEKARYNKQHENTITNNNYITGILDKFLSSTDFTNMVDRLVKERVEIVLQSKYPSLDLN